MGYTRELTEQEKLFCQNLGGVTIFWNHVEASMRLLVHYAARDGATRAIGHKLDVLISNLGNVALADGLTAMADEFNEPMKGHMTHCAKLFDSERIYRNHYVHTPITFHTRGDQTAAFAQQISAKGGALRLYQGQVECDELIAFHDRLAALNTYICALISELIDLPNRMLFASLERPPLPDKLELKRLRLIEHKRQLQASSE